MVSLNAEIELAEIDLDKLDHDKLDLRDAT
jgi:hypothetical protein